MSFLADTNVKNNNDDDLDDGELGDVPEVPKNEESEVKTEAPMQTAEEKRAELKKKCSARRKALRNGGGRNKMNFPTNTADLQKMLQNPETINMMRNMLQNDNLQKMMQQLDANKLGLNIPNFNSEQLNQVVQNMKMAK